jgi:DNA polymerase
MILHIDFETRSATDLKEVGVHDYARHPTTDLWCAAYAFDDEEPDVWLPPDPMPQRVRDHVDSGGEIRAYNSQFERVLWREVLTPRYGWAEPKLEQYSCVMARAYALSLPGDLGSAAAAVGIDAQKDGAGQRLMLQMCRPRTEKPLVWWDQPDKVDRLVAYCKQDVVVEQQLDKRLLMLSDKERSVFVLDQRINDRGVRIDRSLCNAAIKVVAATQDRLDAEMKELTKGQVTRCSNVNELIQFLKTQGVEAESIAKPALLELLDGDLPDRARRALELRQEAAKTSTAKIRQMLNRSERDGFMRGNLQYHGAGTGRWAGRGSQLQNLPRPSQTVDETMLRLLARGDHAAIDMFYGKPLTVVSDCIRSMIVAPEGCEIFAADFSSIEARGVAWVAGQQDTLDVFATGADIYCHAATGIYGRPIDKKNHPDERQVGKVSVLALGYQGGVGAFAKMAKTYNLNLDKLAPAVWESAPLDRFEKAERAYDKRPNGFGLSRQAWMAVEMIKLGWREKNGRIVQLWRDLEDAAIEAVASPGKVTQIPNGKIKFRRAGSFLFCQLPSGRAIAYPYPRLVEKETPWGAKVPGIVYKGVDSLTKKWTDQQFYGGLSAENVTQGLCRDIMVESMQRLESAGYAVVLTVHDEVVTYIKEGIGNLNEFTNKLTLPPAWCADMPISGEAWKGKRYRK